MRGSRSARIGCLVFGALLAQAAWGLTIATVPVGNPGNPGEPSGTGYPQEPSRICGSVGYRYNIAKYEVTSGQYCAFLNAVAGVDPMGLYHPGMWTGLYPGCGIERYSGSGTTESPYGYRVASAYVDRPVSYISYARACRFANWLHNGQPAGSQGPATTEDGVYTMPWAVDPTESIARNPGALWALPTEDEWYKAAYHKNDGVTGNYWKYATCSDICPGRDLNDLTGNNANYYDRPYPIQAPYYTTPVGQFANSPGPYGTFDQTGNMAEYTESFPGRTVCGLRGGSYLHTGIGLDPMMRFGVPTSGASHLTGFRVVQIPEPAGLAALAVVGLMLGRRRR